MKVKPIVFRQGKRLYLRPVFEEDLPLLTQFINDQEVSQFLTVSTPTSPRDERHWFEGFTARKATDLVFAIVLNKGDQLIGIMGLHKISHKDGTATTGSVIGNKMCWGKGYGTEAKMILLEYAFNTLNLRKVNSLVYDFNPRSKRCLEKCGYVEEGRQREQIYRAGRYADTFVMGVFRDEWLPLWEKSKEKFIGASKGAVTK